MVKVDLTDKKNVVEVYNSIDFSDIRKKYKDAATTYAFKVLNEKIYSGYNIKLACFRHLRDLQRIGNKDFPYYYSVADANRIIKFATLLPDVDTGEPIKLMDWQKFIFSSIKGWKNNDGSNRATKLVLSVARGQGKTMMCAILEVYEFLFATMGLSNQDFLVSSNNFTQTQKLFGYIKTMMNKLIEIEPFKTFAKETDLRIQDKQIVQKNTNNVMRSISQEAGRFDSFHFRLAVTDEIGEVKDTANMSKITSGQIKVPNSLLVEISTAYPDPTVPFHKEEDTLIQIMEQDYKRVADDQFCFVWSQDNLNETHPKNDNYMLWAKSNPLLYLKNQKETLLKGLLTERNSLELKGKIQDFQNKNLNMWLQTKVDSYLTLRDIHTAVTNESFNIDNRECYIGFDASQFNDDTAFAFVFPTGNERFYIMQHSFIPLRDAQLNVDIKSKRDGIDYRDAERKGFCHVTENRFGVIDYDFVFNWLLSFIENHNLNVKFFLYDKWNTSAFIKRLDDNSGLLIEPVQQVPGKLSEPTVFMRNQFTKQKISMPNDPILKYSLQNAVLRDVKNSVVIDKEQRTSKIDCVDALIDAFYEADYYYINAQHYEDKSKSPFAGMSEKQRNELLDNITF